MVTTTGTETGAVSRKPPTATATAGMRLGTATATGKEGRASGNVVLKKVVIDDPKKRMEELLTGAITKFKAPVPVMQKSRDRVGGGSGSGSGGEEACPGSGGKSNGYIRSYN